MNDETVDDVVWGINSLWSYLGRVITYVFWLVTYPLWKPLAMLGRYAKSKSLPPILVTQSLRIEDFVGYTAYRFALDGGQKTVRVRFLGSGDIQQIAIDRLNPCHFEKRPSTAEILAAIQKKQ